MVSEGTLFAEIIIFIACHQLEAQLTEQPGRLVGAMLEVEFTEAMEKIINNSSDMLCHRLFSQSLVTLQEKNEPGRQSLPVRNLACIFNAIGTS